MTRPERAAQVDPQAAPDDGRPVRLGLLMRGSARERPFGALTRFAQTVTLLARAENVDVIGFDADDVDVHRGCVCGKRFVDPVRGWVTEKTGLPDVVWNRYFMRDEEDLFDQLQEAGVPLLNERNLNKWEAYCALLADGRVRPHLPETARLTDAGVAMRMLERHPVIYIKPVAGSVGRGIVRAQLEGPGLVRLQYVSRETEKLREVFATDSQIQQWLEHRYRSQRFLVQQGLSLQVFHGRPADVRVLAQKDGSGRWRVTGMGARVAAHGRFTANLHTGGHGVPVELLLEAVCPRDAARRRRLAAQLAELALVTAERLERRAGRLGELGLDFGVDHRGNIWYIEQNAQPGRTLFEHLGRPEIWELAHLRPVQYSKYLARKIAGSRTRRRVNIT